MWGVVRNLVHDGSTILLTTQYLEEADALADEISVIDHGRVIAHDTPTGLKRIVGGQTLTVRPSDPSRLEEAAGIIAEIGQSLPVFPARGTVSVHVAGEQALAAAVEQLGLADIAVTELSLHLPSLDEVFFTLTSSAERRPAGSFGLEYGPGGQTPARAGSGEAVV
jgi:oleandomycin transport system ATP-binding protein